MPTLAKPNIAPFDVDAQRFILAAGLQRSIEKRAINYLVQGLKANNLWVKCTAIYPFVGGNVWSCKFNLKNPRDLNEAFRILFVNSPTVTYNGVDWNGTTQYANTNLTPSTNLLQNDLHLSYYSRENTATNGGDIGTNNGSGTIARTYLFLKSVYSINTEGEANLVNANTTGFFICSRTASNLTTMFRNGASVSTSALASSGLSAVPIFIGCRNLNGTPINFADRQCAFVSIGSGLTVAQSFVFSQLVQQFQVILNRAV